MHLYSKVCSIWASQSHTEISHIQSLWVSSHGVLKLNALHTNSCFQTGFIHNVQVKTALNLNQSLFQFITIVDSFIRNRNEPYLPLPSQPQLVLIYRPRRDGRLSRPWCKVAQAEIRTHNLPIANPALYHTATSCWHYGSSFRTFGTRCHLVNETDYYFFNENYLDNIKLHNISHKI